MDNKKLRIYSSFIFFVLLCFVGNPLAIMFSSVIEVEFCLSLLL